MNLYLIRHGETAWSLSGQHTGTTDLALTAEGEQAARWLAPRLRGIRINQVLVSPRQRARQTCELAGLGAAARTEPDLAEWDYGEYEGLRSAEIIQRVPGWNIWHDGCPGGEQPEQVSARADRLIARLAQTQGTLVLFSHGQFGAALAARWVGLAVHEGQHFPLAPASLSLLSIDAHHPEQRTIALWNERAPSP